VQSIDQAEFLINRTRSYLENQKTGWWKNKAIFSCDDHTKPSSLTFESYHISSLIENANGVNKSVIVKKIMGNEYRIDEFNQKRGMTDDIIEEVNNGALVWYYNGHGSWKQLGDEAYFKLEDINRLNNLDHLTLFIAASCNVSKYDIESYSSMGEQMLFGENGGAIATLGAVRKTGSGPNRTLMNKFFDRVLDTRNYVGTALMLAKMDALGVENRYYTILGDPTLDIMPPITTENLDYGIDGDVKALDTVPLESQLDSQISGISKVLVYDSPKTIIFEDSTSSSSVHFEYPKYGNSIFNGNVTTENGKFNHKFVVPYDINNYGTGRIISYLEDKQNKKHYITYNDDIHFRGVNTSIENTDLPSIKTLLNSDSFVAGDHVSNNPILMAEIEDANGINISGLSGHQIFVQLDDNSAPLAATSSFEYDLDSYTKGKLNYQMPTMEKGHHTMKIIAFDSQNKVGIDSTSFVITNSGITDSADIYISKLLPYPNPYEYDGDLQFTFNLSERSDVTISIYTITGRKIQKFNATCQKGFNSVKWNGRDKDGDKLANNSYIYKIKAKRLDNGRSTEEKAVFTVYK
jgi:hypothetical protein